MKKLLVLLSALSVVAFASCGSNQTGNDLTDAVGNDIPTADVITDLVTFDVFDVRQDVEPDIGIDVAPDTVSETIEETTAETIYDVVLDGEEVTDTGEDIPETCECRGDDDCADVFDDLLPCEKAVCDNCACVRAWMQENDPCDDGNVCTENDMCNAEHVCVGGNNVCGCDSDQDCEMYDDDDLCNGVYKCNLTLATPVCEIDPESIPVCEDTLGLFCRTVGCEPATGQCIDINIHEDESCDDGVACTTGDKCTAGECGGLPDAGLCADDNACTSETCDPEMGCIVTNNSEPCQDGNACTENDYCDSGSCVSGTTVDCDDENQCTADECDTQTGCVHTNLVDVACDNGDSCTADDFCENGSCVTGHEVCCDDSIDNDGNGATDCGDDACFFDCPISTISCTLVSPALYTGAEGETFEGVASVYAVNLTDQTTGYDPHPFVKLQYAVGPYETSPSTWTGWTDAVPDTEAEDLSLDFWTGQFTVPEITDLSLKRNFAFRVSGNNGDNWEYCDLDGSQTGYQLDNAGKITIKPPYQLLFSEYMEGGSFNKAVEIYNAGPFHADLGNCTISVYSNGGTTPSGEIALSDVELAPGDVFVVCHGSISVGSSGEFCDLLDSKLNHNGDDAISLTCEGVVQDVFGVIGVDPGSGWSSGDTYTANHTLRRFCDVTTGTGPDVTEFDDTQWLGLPQDNYLGFGHRLCSGDCFENEMETCCEDSLDSDLDGMTDCEDPDCKATEVCFVPVDWCQHDRPDYVRGSTGMEVAAIGYVFVAGMTDITTGNDAPPDVVAQYGFGPAGNMPDDGTWTWDNGTVAGTNMAPRPDADTYRYSFVIPDRAEGSYDMAFRFSADGGYSWKYCDLDGSDDTYVPADAANLEIVTPPHVLITEYVDGTTNDKALEIYNASGRMLDLSNCMIKLYLDGATTESASFWLESGELPDNSTYVICKTGVSAELVPYCDEFRSLLTFDGNDTIALHCESRIMDSFGKRGENLEGTGWGTGDVTSVLHTLRRACDVTMGDIDIDDAFDPAVEWWGFPVNTFQGLGNLMCGDPCYQGGTEVCCDNTNDDDMDGLADCMDPDCEDAQECQPVLIEWAATMLPAKQGWVFKEMSPNVFGRVFLTGVTPPAGQGAGIIGQAGYGPTGSVPTDNVDWTWVDATYVTDLDNVDDEYTAQFSWVPVGTWDYAFRFSADEGGHWLYADTEPNGSGDGYNPADAGTLTVTAGTETACNDEFDNDGDLAVDCDDDDCVLDPNCIVPSEETVCNDSLDEDQDGATDCDDSDCDDDPVCQEPVDWCQLRTVGPLISQPGPVYQVFAFVREAGVTDATTGNDANTVITAELGWGGAGNDPTTWTWAAGSMAVSNISPDPDADTYYYNFQIPEAPLGEYDFTFRFSADDGRTWLYCDMDGSDNGFDQAGQAGKLTVAGPPNVLISEYVEGSGENKALELTNLSGRTVMMDMCQIVSFSNGATSSDYSINVSGSGTLADGESWVVCNNNGDVTLSAYCDSGSTLLAFNGNDTLKLICEDDLMDVFGQVGTDPGSAGWVSGDVETRNMTLRRKCSVTQGDRNDKDTFDPAVEWHAFPIDTFLDLGMWTCSDACYVDGAEICCADTLDNDNDGLTDCDDSDCASTPACAPANETVCNDGIDEDMDGATDCADYDCVTDVVNCVPETDCANGADDDGDGLTDCADFNCDGNPACPVKLIMSEYGEGSSFNKFVEFYNYGTAPIPSDLCRVLLSRNGGSSVAEIPLTPGIMLMPGMLWVMCHTSFTEPQLSTVCNQTSGSLDFNGDDALLLICAETVIDSFGQAGTDPGSYWGVEPITTINHTLCRADPTTPDRNPADPFDPAVQWLSLPSDFFLGMGVLPCLF